MARSIGESGEIKEKKGERMFRGNRNVGKIGEVRRHKGTTGIVVVLKKKRVINGMKGLRHQVGWLGR